MRGPDRSTPGARPPEADRYRPLPRRRRLLVLLLAVATAVSVILILLDPPGGVQRKAPAPSGAAADAAPKLPAATDAPAPAPCLPGQVLGCVGGKAEVLAIPNASPKGSLPTPASTPAAAASSSRP
jgi:hypothetical protein